MDKYQKAVAKAKEFLKKNARDNAHNLAHHEDVWQTVRYLIKSENLKVNEKLLEVATYWYDGVIGEKKVPSKLNLQETSDFLRNLLPSLDFDQREVHNVTETILHHEFRDTPTTLEGLVLQDADKLDVLSEKRWLRTLGEYKTGKMSKETAASYTKTFFKWVPILSATFHFKTSREMADSSIEAFWKNAEWKKVVRELGFESEYVKAKKEIRSLRMRVLRFVISLRRMIATFLMR